MAAEHEPPIPPAQFDEIIAEQTKALHNVAQQSADMREWLEKQMIRGTSDRGEARIHVSKDLINIWKSIKTMEAAATSLDPRLLATAIIGRLAALKLTELTIDYYGQRIEETREIREKTKREHERDQG